MPGPDTLDDRLDDLRRRAAVAQRRDGLADELESALCEGYMAALQADAAERRTRDGVAAERAAALRRRLNELRREYVRLAAIDARSL